MNGKHRTKVCNVLVVGSGGAGLRAAIAAHDAGAQVLIVGKRHRKDAHTVLAVGGINAAFANVDPEDSWQQHFADTYLSAFKEVLLGRMRPLRGRMRKTHQNMLVCT